MFHRLKPSLLKYSRTSALSSTVEDRGLVRRVWDAVGAKAVEVGAVMAAIRRAVAEIFMVGFLFEANGRWWMGGWSVRGGGRCMSLVGTLPRTPNFNSRFKISTRGYGEDR